MERMFWYNIDQQARRTPLQCPAPPHISLDVIKTADWILDLGPEGGDEGGYIVAEGTPEMVAGVEASYTGRVLRSVLRNRQ